MLLPDKIPQGLEDGRTRDLINLVDADFDIVGIAGRLAKINRFCGATRFPLSVATHSVVVSRLCSPELALTGLLHDITESFGIGDMISPVKEIMPQYRHLESHIHGQLCMAFPALLDEHKIKYADRRATALEALTHRGVFPDWASGVAHPMSEYERDLVHVYYSQEISWQESAETFLAWFDHLNNKDKS
jgi:hypothetical protein